MVLKVKPVLPTSSPAAPERSSAEADEPVDAGRQEQPAPDRPTRSPRSRGTAGSTKAPRGPYGGERKVHFSTSILPSPWEQLEEVADALDRRGRRTSVSALLLALLHFRIPGSETEAATLARSLRRAREAEGLYRGERSVKRGFRVFPSLLDQLDRLGRGLRKDHGIRYPESALLNALIYFHGPVDAAEGEVLLRSFALALDGDTISPPAIGRAASTHSHAP